MSRRDAAGSGAQEHADQDEHQDQHGAGAPQRALHRGVGVPGEVAQQGDAHPLDDPADRVEGQEPAIGHPAGPRQGRHHRWQEGGEPAQQDRPTTTLTQEPSGTFQPSLVPAQQPRLEHSPADVVTDLVADAAPTTATTTTTMSRTDRDM